MINIKGNSILKDNLPHSTCQIYVKPHLKANGLFWYMAKMKIYIFALLMHNFIELYELLMPC